MNNPSTMRALANSKTASANSATQEALAVMTHDSRIRAADKHAEARDAHAVAARAYEKDGRVHQANSHRKAAVLHGQLHDGLMQSTDRVEIERRGGSTVPAVKSDWHSEANDPQKSAGNPLDEPGRMGNPAARAASNAQDEFPGEGEVAAMSEHDYTPGMMTAASDQELDAVIARGKTVLSNPPKIEEYYRNAMVDEAHAQKNRRWQIANGKSPMDAFHDPKRSAVQMQSALDPGNTPWMRPAATAASTMKPVTAMTDAELASVVDMSRNQRAEADAPFAPPVSESSEKSARSEMFKRALDPRRGTRINPTSWPF